MDAVMLRNLVEVQAHQSSQDEVLVPLTAPQRAVPRTYPGAPHKDDSIELQRVARDDEGAVQEPSARSEDDDLEGSRPASPVGSVNAVEVLPSVWEPFMNRYRLAAVCLANFCGALNDGAAGALIPYMEK
jgi:hypothetical protein